MPDTNPDHKFGLYAENILSQWQPDMVAEVAIRLIERWGLVTAHTDGEDSAGRAKLRLETPTEVVDRAFAIAEAYVTKAHGGGHLRDLGPLADRKFLMQSYDAWRILPVKTSDFIDELAKRRTTARESEPKA